MSEHDSSRDQRSRWDSGPAMGQLLNRLLGDGAKVGEQIDKNARALAQTALSKLEVVSREEFDSQTAVLERTRQRVQQLEQELETLTAELHRQRSES